MLWKAISYVGTALPSHQSEKLVPMTAQGIFSVPLLSETSFCPRR